MLALHALPSFLTSRLPCSEQVRLIQVAEPQQHCLSHTEDLYGIRFSHWWFKNERKWYFSHMCVTFLEGERKSFCTGSFIDNSVSHLGLFSWLGVLKWATNCITSQVLGPSAPLTRVGFFWLPQIPSCFWEEAPVPCCPSSRRFIWIVNWISWIY